MTSRLIGSLRLYAVVAGLWASIWGYLAYDAHRVYAFNRDYVAAMDASPKADRSNYGLADLHRYQFLTERNFDLVMLTSVPLGLPFVIAGILWIAAGFRAKDK